MAVIELQNFRYDTNDINICDAGGTTSIYFDDDNGSLTEPTYGTELYLDNSLSTPVDDGFYSNSIVVYETNLGKILNSENSIYYCPNSNPGETIKINTCDKEWFGKDYVFYDKQGNPMNILYDDTLDMYSGKLFFDQNSSDTYKTLEINSFERIRGFEYQQYYEGEFFSYDELKTQKFQLFNTNNIEFIGNQNSVSITKIEAVNDEEGFFSKWIYSDTDIQNLFPRGTEIKFNRDIFGIASNETYTVIASKIGAIMIITNTNNEDFISNIGGNINNTSLYDNLRIEGVNGIKLYDYIDKDFNNNYPSWSEPSFYNQLYTGQKLNIVNSINEGIYTLKTESLGDNYYNIFSINTEDINNDFKYRIENKTSNIKLYSGNVKIESNVLYINNISSLFFPGASIVIPKYDDVILTIDDVSDFNLNSIYSTGSMVYFENNFYTCIESYTQSYTSDITPLNTTYWERSKSIPIKESVDDFNKNASIYLNSNFIEFPYTFNNSESKIVNLSKSINIYESSLNQLGIDVTIDELGEYILFKSMYPTDYIDLDLYTLKIDSFSGSTTANNNFATTSYSFNYDPVNVPIVKYNNNIIPISEDYTSSTAYGYFSKNGAGSSDKFSELTSDSELYWKSFNANFGLTAGDEIIFEYETNIIFKSKVIERILEVEENIENEFRNDLSERKEERILFNDIGDHLRIIINEQAYEVDSTTVFRNDGSVDTEESIDLTLKAFIDEYKYILDRRGIYLSAEYFGSNNVNSLNNSLFLRTHYPNVPLDINMDINENYYNILNNSLIIYDIDDSGQLNITINNISYIEKYDTSVENTIENWVNNNQNDLNDRNIYIDRIFQTIIFKRKDTEDINIQINTGKFLPGEKTFEQIKYKKGHEGVIISSNKIIQDNPDISFEQECFSTGQIIGIENTDYILDNQEYNVIQLDPDKIVLSYQGPFWGTIDNQIQNAFLSLSFGEKFKIGDYILYYKDGNLISGEVTQVTANYYQVLTNNDVTTVERQNAFYYDPSATASITIPEESEVTIKELEYSGNIIDIDYINSTYDISCVTDTVNFVDKNFRKDTFINIDNPIKQILNPYNNLLYILADNNVYIIDPYLESVRSTVSNLGTGNDIEVDSVKGDVYVSYTDSDRIMIIDPNDYSFISFDYITNYEDGFLRYNRDDEFMYVYSNDNTQKKVYRIDTNSQNTHEVLIEGATASGIGLSSSDSRITYNMYNEDMYIPSDGELKIIDKSNNILVSTNIPTIYYSTATDNLNKYMWVSSSDGKLYFINEQGNINNFNIGKYGYLYFNQRDNNLYIATQDGSNELLVFSVIANQIIYTISLDTELDKIISNRYTGNIIGKESNTLYSIDTNLIYEVNEVKDIIENVEELDENRYGRFSENYTESDFIKLTTREFIRFPRKNYETTGAPQAKWLFKWENNDDEIFMVDISGDHLEQQGDYRYTGEKPLSMPVLRRKPNRDLSLVDKSYSQQTIFRTLEYVLDYNDSEENVSFIPKGLQTILGFNNKDESVSNNVLNIYEKEDISLNYPTYDSYVDSVTLPDQHIFLTDNNGQGEITLSSNSTDTFIEKVNLNNFTSNETNLKEGQIINIRIKDGNFISENDNVNVKILDISPRKLIVEYLDRNFIDETVIDISVKITVKDKKIITFDVYGQTEIEDERYRTELANTGKLINPEDIFIFKEYDIKEGGMDWKFMNSKRRELLTVRNDIYNYLGAYRSIINTIHFFGYDDLELNEYFQNINPDSESYLKLFKVEVNDIFNVEDENWGTNFEYYKFPNENYEETKLFNLTYKITDFDGNNLLTYSLEEALIKLEGLKHYLEKNIIPLTHDIKDIAGELSFKSENQSFDLTSNVRVLNMKDTMDSINFNINELYVMPIQTGSSVYNSVVDFEYLETYPDYFTLNVKTYKTYDKWEAFTSYELGEKVDYFGKIYENVLVDPFSENNIINRNNNPLEFEDVDDWELDVEYQEGNEVKYERDYYRFSLRTENINYPPWETATGSCVIGDTEDNFYNDLLDRIGNEPNVPNYFFMNEDSIGINFDILDIIKNDYPNKWCELLDYDESVISDLIISMMNMPSNQYEGDKPPSERAARGYILRFIRDYNRVKDNYKYKYIDISPAENLLLENEDFILWDKITKWKEIDIELVQDITEYRSGKNMLKPFNFTLDSKIDPYVILDCRFDNGYGQIKSVRKSYELRFDADPDKWLITRIR